MDGEYMLVKTTGVEALNAKLDTMLERLNGLSQRLDKVSDKLDNVKVELGQAKSELNTLKEPMDFKTTKEPRERDPRETKGAESPKKMIDLDSHAGIESRAALATRHRVRPSRPVYAIPEAPRHFKAIRQKKKEMPTYAQISESMSVAPSEETPEDEAEDDHDFVVKKVE
jgi:chromosome segregation ATPase